MNIVVFTLTALVFSMAACNRDKRAATTPQPSPRVPSSETENHPSPVVHPSQSDGSPAEPEQPDIELKTVYFAYDSTLLDEQARGRLRNNAHWLESHGEQNLRIEGNADERGTSEYNIALGMERARTVEDYLVRLGISPERLDTISYGEENPAVPGQYAKNRRAEFVPR